MLQSGNRSRTLDRRTALLLACLAVEGSMNKYRLAGMLWPDSEEVTARANMRQLLRRLRVNTCTELVQGQTTLQLTDTLQVDLGVLLRGEPTASQVLALDGEVLEGIEADDLPDLQEWLVGVRERVSEVRRLALNLEIQRLEKQGAWQEALLLAGKVLHLDRLSEEGYRTLMRLHHLLGDRGAALAAFERCREVLREHLGLDPSAQTLTLAREIQQGDRQDTDVPVLPRLPLGVLRPPVLVGRSAAWNSLSRGHHAGKLAILTAESGMGRTRLALDFALQQGQTLHVVFRAADQRIPYAGLSRLLRGLLKGQQEDQLEGLPGWIRQEMGRIVPSLSSVPLPPLTSDLEQLHFFDGITEGIRWLSKDIQSMVLDDWQHVDPASGEFLHYLFSRVLPTSADHTFCLLTCTEGPLTHGLQDLIKQELAFQVHLQGLESEDLQEMLSHMGEPLQDPALQERLIQYAAGKPLLLVEAARYLLESGTSQLPGQGEVVEVLQKRLGELSADMLRVARAAAILGRDLSLQRVAAVLGNAADTLQLPWNALHEKQLLQADRFTHTELPRMLLENIPQPVRSMLHRTAAGLLMHEKAPAAEIAHHWLNAGHPMEAAEEFTRAGQEAMGQFRAREAAQFYGQAADLHEALGMQSQAFEALTRQAAALRDLVDLDAHASVLGKLGNLARTPSEQAVHHLHLSEYHHRRGNMAEMVEAAHKGIILAQQAENHLLELSLLEVLVFAAYYQGDLDHALTLIHQARDLAVQHGEPLWQALFLEGEAVLVGHQDPEAAIALLLQAEALYFAGNDLSGCAAAANKRGTALLKLGEVRQARNVFLKAHTTLQDVEGHDDVRINSIYGFSLCEQLLGHHQTALEWIRDVGTARYRHLPLHHMLLQMRLSGILLWLGSPEAALNAMNEVLQEGQDHGYHRTEVMLLAARIHRHLGHPTEALSLLEQAKQSLEEHPDGFTTIRLSLEETASLPPPEQLERLNALEVSCQARGMLRIAAALGAHRALVHLELGLERLEVNLSEAHLYFFGMEDRWLLQAFEAALLPRPEAQRVLSKLRVQVRHWVTQHVPPQHRTTYLMGNPQMVRLQRLVGALQV